ncbi:MAG TPA: hypothetical protein VNZ03_36360 [Terriglobales bacterium]|jgi:hypothetical protein|nr:hypothetical protein [Terriglobales bacterium]
MKPRTRKTANLSESVHQQLNMYTLAAGAAGVSLFSLTPPCDAKIVYTPAHVVIGHGGTNLYYIDLNHDGISDLAIATSHNSCTSECLVNLNAFPLRNEVDGKKVRSHSSSFSSAFVLRPGAMVGPRAPFIQGSEFGCAMLRVFSFPTSHYRKLRGKWHDVTDRYLGVKFSIRGKTHFGWARLTVHDKGHAITAVLSGYAYETVPNKPIIAGKTKGPDDAEQPASASLTIPAPKAATLGALALGTPGLSIWRREESVSATPERN